MMVKRTEMIAKAKDYKELAEKGTNLSKKEIAKKRELCRELSARGLDPQHMNGLEERALVYANLNIVGKYCALRPDSKRIKAKARELRKLGIEPDQQHLSRILADLKSNAKKIDRKKSTKGFNVNRKQAEEEQLLIEAELETEELIEAAVI